MRLLNGKEWHVPRNFGVSYNKSRVFHRPELNLQIRLLYKVCDGLQNIALFPIPKEDGENRQMQDVLHFCLRPMVVPYYIKLFCTGPKDTKVF